MEARRAEAELERRRADALLTACDLGLTDDVAALIAGGATFEATDKAGVRPMTFAAARGHADVVELLCSHGVDANDDDALGRAPLHFAAMHGRARVVRALASRPGTWVDPPDHLDDTPLTLAARMADAETIAALLDAGADARARNKAGLTPLGEALLVRRRFDLADLLLEHEAGRQTDAPREKGSRDDASRRKRELCSRLETKKILETTTAGPGGWSLVVAAAAFGAEDTLAWLRDKGVDVDAVLAAGGAGTKRSADASDASKPNATNATNATNDGVSGVSGVSGFSVSGFAALSADARLRTARGWAATPVERRSAPGSGVPQQALRSLEVRDALVREVEKRDFLQKLVDDDEFQNDMALSYVRDAVDAVVRDFNAVARFTGDARVMRVLEKFRVVQRFCKARGFKITFADVRVADAAEAEARRRKVGELRERADAALAAACRAALEINPGAGIEQPGSTAVSKQASKPLSLGNVLGHVIAQPAILSLVAALVALCVAPRVSALARRAFGKGRFFFEGDGDDSYL